MALKSNREGLRKESVDYLGNIIVNKKLKQDIVNSIDDVFVNKSDVLSLEEIEASSDLSGKIASASALKGIMTNSLPCYTYDFSHDTTYNNAYNAIVKLRTLVTECFDKGSVIHIKNANGGFHTYLIGSTNFNYFMVYVLSFYVSNMSNRAMEVYRYSDGTWSKWFLNQTEF